MYKKLIHLILFYSLSAVSCSEEREQFSNAYNLTNSSYEERYPTWSSDGTKIFYEAYQNDNWDIYSIQLDNKSIKKLTDYPSNERYPALSPNNEQIVFQSDHEGEVDLYILQIVSGKLFRLTDIIGVEMYPHWSPDGQQIVFNSDKNGNADIYIIELTTNMRLVIEHEGQE